MSSTQFTVNGTDTSPAEVIVAPGSVVSLAVDSLSGLDTIEWSVEASSDSDLAPPTITPAGTPSGATATFTIDDTMGVAYRILCTGNGNTSSPIYARAVIGTPDVFGGAKLTLDEDDARDATDGWLETYNASIEGKPFASGSFETEDATPEVLATIPTFDDFIYVLGIVTNSREGTNLAYDASRVMYKNIGGTLTQVGSDVDDDLNFDNITVTGVSHTTSSENIVVSWTGAGGTDVKTQYWIQIYQNKWDDHS